MRNKLAPILVTAGPTYEPIDAVRFIGNRSSGRMGVAIAEAARAAGHETFLLLGPSCLKPTPGANDDEDENEKNEINAPDHHHRPARLTVRRFQSCADLENLLTAYWPARANTLIMAAAVADYRPKKSAGGAAGAGNI